MAVLSVRSRLHMNLMGGCCRTCKSTTSPSPSCRQHFCQSLLNWSVFLHHQALEAASTLEKTVSLLIKANFLRLRPTVLAKSGRVTRHTGPYGASMNNGRWAGPIYNVAALGDALCIRQQSTLSIPLNNAKKMRQAEAGKVLVCNPAEIHWCR